MEGTTGTDTSQRYFFSRKFCTAFTTQTVAGSEAKRCKCPIANSNGNEKGGIYYKRIGEICSVHTTKKSIVKQTVADLFISSSSLYQITGGTSNRKTCQIEPGLLLRPTTRSE